MDKIQVATNQVLRGLVLQTINEAKGAGMELICAVLKQHGYTVDKAEVIIICHYLKGKNLITVDSVGNKGVGIHRDIAYITPQGIDTLEGTLEVDGIELSG